MSKQSEYLQSKGWRKVGERGGMKYWDHPDHQPARHGCFITFDAVSHQRNLDKGWICACIPHEPEAGRDA